MLCAWDHHSASALPMQGISITLHLSMHTASLQSPYSGQEQREITFGRAVDTATQLKSLTAPVSVTFAMGVVGGTVRIRNLCFFADGGTLRR